MGELQVHCPDFQEKGFEWEEREYRMQHRDFGEKQTVLARKPEGVRFHARRT